MKRSGGEESLPGGDVDADVTLGDIPLHSTNLLTVLDADGTVRYESPAIERLFGFEQEEVVGERASEYFHPEDREAVVEAFEAVVAGDADTVTSVEYRHERADGTYCWVESVASANPTPGGRYVVNTRDISDQKARERDLVRTNERLDEFAEVLSHDLRNPLQVARGRLELVSQDCDSDDLGDIERAHDRMETLIEGLLTVARDGTTVTEPEWVDLPAVVSDGWRTVETHEATLVTASEQTVRADRSRLQQMLENLVRNAVEHGGHDVTVVVGELDDGFYVADDGPGISTENPSDVFGPDYSTSPAGNGLGLRIVDQVVDAHDWTVRVSESEDGGTRFEIANVEFAR